MSQMHDEPIVVGTEAIPGVAPANNNVPIPPPDGFVPVVEQVQPKVETNKPDPGESLVAIQIRVKDALSDFHRMMEDPSYDPHPAEPVTLEEIDDVIKDADILLMQAPTDPSLLTIKQQLLEFRKQFAAEQEQKTQPNPDVLTQPEIKEIQHDEIDEADAAIAALNAEQDSHMQALEHVPNARIISKPDPKPEPVQPTAPAQPTPAAQPSQVVKSVDAPKVNACNTGGMDIILPTKQQVKRVDDAPADGVKIHGVYNPSLESFLKYYFDTGNIQQQINITGVTIYKKKRAGLWEEGGASENKGSVLLVTSSDGRKMIPIIAYDHMNSLNGRHALLPVYNGSYVVLGGQKAGKMILGVYRIDNIEIVKSETDEENMESKMQATLVAYTASPNVLLYFGEVSEEVKKIWTINAPAFQAALKRMYEANASNAIFVHRYQQCFTDLNDLTACTQDNDFVCKLESVNTIGEAYAKIGNILGDAKTLLNPKQKQANLIIVLNYAPSINAIAVYLLGVVYNLQSKTSAGGRLAYMRVILRPGDRFYYPDKDPDQDVGYEEMVEKLSQTGNNMVVSLVRLTR